MPRSLYIFRMITKTSKHIEYMKMAAKIVLLVLVMMQPLPSTHSERNMIPKRGVSLANLATYSHHTLQDQCPMPQNDENQQADNVSVLGPNCYSVETFKTNQVDG